MMVAARAAGGSRTIFWLCIAVAILEGFDLQVAGVIAPRLVDELELTSGQLGLFFSASTFGLLFGALAGGPAADRLGRVSVLSFSVLAFGAASILTGFATSAEELILTRFLTGLGLGGALPNLIALISENTAPRRQKRAIGYLYCGVPVGGAAVSLAGAVAGEAWRLLLFAGGILPIMLAAALWLSRGLSRNDSQAAAGAAFGPVHCLFGSGRAVPTMLLWISFLATLVILYLVLNWLPLVLAGMGLTANEALVAQVSFNVGGLFACLLTAPLLDSRRAWLVALGAFFAVPVLLYALSLVASPGAAISIALLLGGAILVTQSFLYSIAPTIYPVGGGGTGTGAAVAWGRIGSIIGPLYGGILIAGNDGTRGVLLGTLPAAIIAGGAAITLALHLRAPRHREGSAPA